MILQVSLVKDRSAEHAMPIWIKFSFFQTVRLLFMCISGLFCFNASAQAVLFEDNFDEENNEIPIVNYDSLSHWDILSGSVDLIGNGFMDAYPDRGLYLDLDGTTREAATLQSKDSLALERGDILQIEFDLAGSVRSMPDTDSLLISLGTSYSELFILENEHPIDRYVRQVEVLENERVPIKLEHLGGDNFGVLFDFIRIERVTRVNSDESDDLNRAVTLFQNYPNPFSESTQIRYFLDTPGTIRIRVFDALGRLLSTLEEGHKNHGAHLIHFNRLQLAQGVYYYHLDFRGRSFIKQMVIID
ncbi:MAG: T9SS type A sorting domain-containing protein [Rhodothermaceae bacterium]|nr:T9SS type A sorting domain-containing protein [Rhodothermaceae bacterium]